MPLLAGAGEHRLAEVSDLAISLFATCADSEYADARQRTLLDRIKGYIETHFRDPGLPPDGIASAANISTRYLHKLLQGEHETVAFHLREMRLQHARDELLDPRLAHRGVAAIAHGCGFGDISGFNRAFKAAYSINPRDLRREAMEPKAKVAELSRDRSPQGGRPDKRESARPFVPLFQRAPEPRRREGRRTNWARCRSRLSQVQTEMGKNRPPINATCNLVNPRN